MNSKLIASAIIAVSAFASTGAFAAGLVDSFPLNTPKSTLSAEKVRSEMAQAQARGEMRTIGDLVSEVKSTPAPTALTRAEVRQELARVNSAGQNYGDNPTL